MSTMSTTIRPATPDDAGAMVRLHRAAVQAVDDAHYSREVREAWSPVPTPEREAWLVGRITDPTVLALVAMNENGDIAGFAFASLQPGKLHALYVHPDLGGQGIGRQLLAQVEAQARASATEVMELMASRNAVAFYAACGYARMADATQALADGTVMDAVHMQRVL